MNENAFATQLRSAVMRQRIYPSGSPALEEGIRGLHALLLEAFDTRDALVVSRTGDKFFVEKQAIASAEHLLAIFADHKIQGLSLQRDITPQEVRELVECLGQKPTGERAFAELLLSRNVTHVHVNQIRLLEASEEETLVNKGLTRFQSLTSFEELKDTLNESMSLIDKVPGAVQQEHLRRHLAERMVLLEATMIRELFEKPLPTAVEEKGILNLFLDALSENRVMEILNEVIRWDQRIRGLPDSSQQFKEEKARLRTFTAKLLTAPAAKRMGRPAYEDLQKRGLIDAVPEALEGQESRDIGREAQRLIDEKDDRFLDGGGPQGLPGLFQRVFDLHAAEWAPPLLARLRTVLESAGPTERFRAAVAGHKILPILWQNQREDLASALCKTVLLSAQGDRVKAVYKELAEVLVDVSAHYFRAKNFARALEPAEMFRRHRAERNPLAEGQAQAAGEALRRLVEELRDLLVEDLMSGEDARAEPASRLLAEAGDRATPVYLEIIRTTKDGRLRQVAAECLARYDAAARAALGGELSVSNSSQTILNIISVLKDFLGPETLAGLSNLLYYPDVDIRKVIARSLMRIADDRSSELLARLLLDPEEGVRIVAIEALGERRWKPALDALLGLLNQKSTGEQEEVCLALGKIGDERAVEPLAQLLRGKGGVFRAGRSTEEAVRVRAAWALARIAAPSALEKLSAFREDPNPMVHEIARKGAPSAGGGP